MNYTDPYNIIGELGVIFILFGIWRTRKGRWKFNSLFYELDTVIGAGLLLIYQIHLKAYIVMPINIALVFISFRGLSSFAERYAVRKERTIKRNLKKRLR